MGKMRTLEKWAADNAYASFENYRAEWDIPFVIWKKKWEIYDIIGYRQGSQQIINQMAQLSEECILYRNQYLIYRSKWEIYQGNFQQAYDTMASLRQDGTQCLSDLELAEILSQWSLASLHLSRFDEAIEQRRQALAIYKKHGDMIACGQALLQMGMTKWKKGDYRWALSDLEEAERIFLNSKDRALLAYTKINIANVYLATDEVEGAYQNYIQALEICRDIGDVVKQSSILNNLGAIFYRKSEYRRSLECYQKGYEIDRMIGNLPGQASKLNNMAVMAASLGRYQEALEKFSLALEIDKKTGNLEGQMKKLGNMSSFFGLLGEREKALDCIEESLSIARRIGSKGYLSFGLGLRSDILGGLGRLEEAEENAQEALALAEECGNLSLVANCCLYLAEIYMGQGLYDRALGHSWQAVETMESNNLFEANQEMIYFIHYQALNKLGRKEEADKYLDSAYQAVCKKLDNMPQEVDRDALKKQNNQYKMIIEEWQRIRGKK